jgi:hypothetical protein
LEFFFLIGHGGSEAWDYTGINTELIELLGRGYIVEHCIASYNRRTEERMYRIYMTDILNALNTNFAKYFGGSMYKERYADWIDTAPKEKEKSGDEIAAEIIVKWNLKQKETEE